MSTQSTCTLCSSDIGLERVDCSQKHLFCSDCIIGWINSQLCLTCFTCNEPITMHGTTLLKLLDGYTLHRSFAYNPK